MTRPKNIINIPENFISKILFKLRNSPIEVVVRANNKKIIENERVKIRVFNININEESLASFLMLKDKLEKRGNMHGEKNDIRPALKAKIIDESTII